MCCENSTIICNRFIFTKCRGQNCYKKHITPRELWKVLKEKNAINLHALNAVTYVPYCKNFVSGRCNGKRCHPDKHKTTKEVMQFLITNNIVSKDVVLN